RTCAGGDVPLRAPSSPYLSRIGPRGLFQCASYPLLDGFFSTTPPDAWPCTRRPDPSVTAGGAIRPGHTLSRLACWLNILSMMLWIALQSALALVLAEHLHDPAVGAEQPEVPALQVLLPDVPEELAHHPRRLGGGRPGAGHLDGVIAEVGHLQVAQQ